MKNEHFALYMVDSNALNLTVRTGNCLKAANIIYIGELIQNTESDLYRIPHLGCRGVNEIKEKLAHIGMALGTKLPSLPSKELAQI